MSPKIISKRETETERDRDIKNRFIVCLMSPKIISKTFLIGHITTSLVPSCAVRTLGRRSVDNHAEMKEIGNSRHHDTYITVLATMPGLFGFVRRRCCCCFVAERVGRVLDVDAETTVTESVLLHRSSVLIILTYCLTGRKTPNCLLTYNTDPVIAHHRRTLVAPVLLSQYSDLPTGLTQGLHRA